MVHNMADKMFKLVEVFNGFMVEHVPSGKRASCGDGCDRYAELEEGEIAPDIGSAQYLADWDDELNANQGETLEAYFPEMSKLEVSLPNPEWFQPAQADATELPIAEQLEAMIDSIGLAKLLDTIAIVCLEKSEHVLTNWQDKTLAKQWSNAYQAVVKCSVHKSVISLP